MGQATYFAHIFNQRVEGKVLGIPDISKVLLRDTTVKADQASFDVIKIHVGDTLASVS